MPSTPSDGPFEILAALSDAGVFVMEPTGRVLWCNAYLRERIGLGSEDLQFEHRDNPFIHREDLPRVARFLAAFAKSDAMASEPLHNRFVDRWGRVLHVRTRLAKMDWHGRSAVVAHCREVAADGAESRHDTEVSYQNLVENAEDLILKLDQKGRILFANQRLRDATGLSLIEQGKATLFDLLDDDDVPSAKRALQAVYHEGTRQDLEVRLKHKDGDIRQLQGPLVCYAWGDGDHVCQAFLRDVTESLKLRERVERTQRLESLGLLAGGIAHDFNNLLTGILANASFVAEATEPGPTHDCLKAILTAGQRAAALTQQMLAYAGRAQVERVPVDVAALVGDLEAMLGRGLAESVALRVRVPNESVWVSGSHGQLTQVVMNLVTNAAEASPQGEEVTVDVGRGGYEASQAAVRIGERPSGPCCWFRVRDCGHGMDAQLQARIFDPFFTTKDDGRGLGLSAVVGIVRQHRGCIFVSSRPGVGTTFTVELPLKDSSEVSRPPTSAASSQPGPRPTLLVVDDEPVVLTVTTALLQNAGYEVVAVSNGADALEQVRRDPARFGLVLLDHTMPHLTGTEVRERLRELVPDVPVLMMSGWRQGDVLDQPTLQKPFSMNDLLDAVTKALALLD